MTNPQSQRTFPLGVTLEARFDERAQDRAQLLYMLQQAFPSNGAQGALLAGLDISLGPYRGYVGLELTDQGLAATHPLVCSMLDDPASSGTRGAELEYAAAELTSSRIGLGGQGLHARLPKVWRSGEQVQTLVRRWSRENDTHTHFAVFMKISRGVSGDWVHCLSARVPGEHYFNGTLTGFLWRTPQAVGSLECYAMDHGKQYAGSRAWKLPHAYAARADLPAAQWNAESAGDGVVKLYAGGRYDNSRDLIEIDPGSPEPYRPYPPRAPQVQISRANVSELSIAWSYDHYYAPQLAYRIALRSADGKANLAEVWDNKPEAVEAKLPLPPGAEPGTRYLVSFTWQDVFGQEITVDTPYTLS